MATDPARPEQRVLIGAFLVALTLPALIGLARHGDRSWPEIKTWRTGPAQIDEWFTARLAGRMTMRTIDGLVKVRVLGVSASRDVILGHEGWLFLHESNQYGKGQPPPDPEKQASLWKSSFDRRRDWLAARDIRYVVAVVPEKATIFPGFLPKVRNGPTDSALDYLFCEDGARHVDLIDLRVPIRAANAGGATYFRTDTHWNARGAAVALSILAERLSQLGSTAPHVFVRPVGSDGEFRRGDLARLLGLGGRLSEIAPAPIVARRARRLHEPVLSRAELRDPPQFQPQIWSTGLRGRPDVVFFHDSFGDALIPGLADLCVRLVCLPTWSFDPDAVDHYRPQIVVQEIAERAITWRGPSDPIELTRP